MSIVFCPTERLFIDSDLWPHDLPEIPVPVSPEDHARILDELSTGRILSADEAGQPITVEAPPPSAEALASAARRRRDAEIVAVRWLLDRDADEAALELPRTLTPAQIVTIRQHVQALRDVPEQPGFPAVIDWPALPSELNTATENT